MAQALSRAVREELLRGAYALRLTGNGRLQWIEQRGHRTIVHDVEPNSPAWKRALVALLATLPIEGLL